MSLASLSSPLDRPHRRPHERLTAAGIGLLMATILGVASPASAWAADSNGAGGSPIDQILIATVGATLQTLLLLWLGLGHRSGRVKLLGRAADWTERRSGLPGWAALPMAVATTSLLVAVFGMYWDIALHMGVGRDEGPLANAAHYFILYGLFGIFTAGFLSIVLPLAGREAPGGTFIKLTSTWYAPLGGVLICACGAFALVGFPLDDSWHRIFGQDVTLWGPTHLMLIGGASMTLIGIAVLVAEGMRANEVDPGGRVTASWVPWARRVALSGGLLLGLSTFQAEFDFGIPQFRFVLQPVMLMAAMGVGLVSVRVWGGKGSALGAVAFFLVVRAILTVLVGPVLGEVTPMFPLYLVGAILVELVALKVSTTRPLAFGLACGVALGTVGLASEWGWSQLVMSLPMPASLLPLGVPFGVAGAIGASVVGAWIGTRLLVTPTPSTRGLRIGAVAGALTITALIGLGLPKPVIEGQSATVALTDVPATGDVGRGGRNVKAIVTLDPPSAAKDAQWLTITAWQGDGVVVDRLRKIGDGRYETTKPIPVHGSWKAMIRLGVGQSLAALPVHLPQDTAIPAPEVPASATFTRPFIADHAVLQREQKPAAAALTIAAYLTVGGITVLLLILLVWGLHRFGSPPARREISPPRPARGALRRTPARSQPRSSAAEAG